MAKLPKHINLSHERLKAYEENKDLFKGNAWDVFAIKQFDYYKKINPENPRLSYINYNYFGILTRTTADLIFNGGIDIKVEDDQDWFDDWSERQNFMTKVYELLLSNSYYGDAAIKIGVNTYNPYNKEDKDSDVQLTQLNPAIWFPKYDPDSPKLPVENHTLVFTRTITDDTNHVIGTAYLLEIHSYGSISYQGYYRRSDDRQLEEGYEYEEIDPNVHFGDMLDGVLRNAAKQEQGIYEYDTKITRPLVVHIPNFSLPDEYFGMSDYSDDIKSVNYAINDGYTSIESVRKKHIDPMLVVPESVIKAAIKDITGGPAAKSREYGYATKKEAVSHVQENPDAVKAQVAAKILEKTRLMGVNAQNADIKPEYITWDAKLEAAFNQITELKNNLALQAELSPVLTNPDQKIGALTGIAIKRLAAPTLNKAQRKAMYLSKGLEQIIKTAYLLALKTDGIKQSWKPKESADPKVTVTFKDGLIEDIMETIQKNEQLLNNSMISKLDALMDVFKYTKEEAEKKLEEIKESVANELPFEPEIEDQEEQEENTNLDDNDSE